ncbi:MAG TPA: PDZ domain-containing protein [Anaerolineae bacterium]|nr:PDZ domain-containing protein [Anaerolineae bacterium]
MKPPLSQRHLSLGQVLAIALGALVVIGGAALTGGAVGYRLGNADGQSLARAQQRIAIATDGAEPTFAFRLPLSGFSLPQPLPPEGEVPPEFKSPQAYLGVRFESIDEALAQAENLAVAEGAIIREVLADSPAAEAGLQVDDLIGAVNGEPVDAQHSLTDRIAAYQPQATIELAVLRGGETQSIRVNLGERADFEVEGFQFRVPRDRNAPFFFGDPSNCLPRGEQG